MGNQERFVRYTSEELQGMRDSGEDQTNWERVNARTDAEIEAAIDHQDEGDFDWSNIQIGLPPSKQQLTVRFDLEVIDWFRSQGAGYQTKMNQVLRKFVEAQQQK